MSQNSLYDYDRGFLSDFNDNYFQPIKGELIYLSENESNEQFQNTREEEQIFQQYVDGQKSGTQIIIKPDNKQEIEVHRGLCIVRKENPITIKKNISKKNKVLPGSNKNTAKSLSTHFQNFLRRIFKNSKDINIRKMEKHPDIQAYLSTKISSKKNLLEIIKNEALSQFASEFFGNLKWLRGILNGNKSSFIRIDECFAENQEYLQELQLVQQKNSTF